MGRCHAQLDYLRQEAEQDLTLEQDVQQKQPQGAKPDAWSQDCNLLRERMAAVRTHTHNNQRRLLVQQPGEASRVGNPQPSEGGLELLCAHSEGVCVFADAVCHSLCLYQVRAAERGRVAEDVLYASILARMAEFDVRPTCGCAEGDLAWLHSPRAQVRFVFSPCSGGAEGRTLHNAWLVSPASTVRRALHFTLQ